MFAKSWGLSNIIDVEFNDVNFMNDSIISCQSYRPFHNLLKDINVLRNKTNHKIERIKTTVSDMDNLTELDRT